MTHIRILPEIVQALAIKAAEFKQPLVVDQAPKANTPLHVSHSVNTAAAVLRKAQQFTRHAFLMSSGEAEVAAELSPRKRNNPASRKNGTEKSSEDNGSTFNKSITLDFSALAALNLDPDFDKDSLTPEVISIDDVSKDLSRIIRDLDHFPLKTFIVKNDNPRAEDQLIVSAHLAILLQLAIDEVYRDGKGLAKGRNPSELSIDPNTDSMTWINYAKGTKASGVARYARYVNFSELTKNMESMARSRYKRDNFILFGDSGPGKMKIAEGAVLKSRAIDVLEAFATLVAKNGALISSRKSRRQQSQEKDRSRQHSFSTESKKTPEEAPAKPQISIAKVSSLTAKDFMDKISRMVALLDPETTDHNDMGYPTIEFIHKKLRNIRPFRVHLGLWKETTKLLAYRWVQCDGISHVQVANRTDEFWQEIAELIVKHMKDKTPRQGSQQQKAYVIANVEDPNAWRLW